MKRKVISKEVTVKNKVFISAVKQSITTRKEIHEEIATTVKNAGVVKALVSSPKRTSIPTSGKIFDGKVIQEIEHKDKG